MSRVQKKVAKWVGALALLFCSFSFSNAQVVVGATETPVVTNPTFYDDSYVSVPLQFGFPFYGRTFTNSWMHSNGVVSFLDPAAPIEGAPYNPAQWAYCCEGINLTPGNGALGPQFNYMIAPLWTDLYPTGASSFRTEGTSQYQLYQWNNIAEISNMNNLNSFSLRIRPSGSIESMYSLINIQNQNVTAGITGDVSLGQMQQFYYGRGIIPGTLGNWSVNETIADQCTSNPLSSPTCPGYAAAYQSQQCSISPLYSPSCPGYAQAYYTQQCSANPLYDINCPGYATAYLNYQCSINPLYSTTCEGYEQAYFSQQCSLDGLYSRQCPNYAEAYAAAEALKPKEEAPVIVVAQVQTSTTPQLVADPVVNSVVTTTATTAAPAASPAAPVTLTPQPQPATTAAAVSTTTSKESKEDKPASTAAPQSASNEKKDEPKTARQELQAKREAAAREKAVNEGKNLAENIGNAVSMEQQVAVQNVVIQAMGYTPGFDAYGKAMIPDNTFYKPFTIYNNQRNIDNRSANRMFGGSDRIHEQMVDSQYREADNGQ